MKLITAVVKPFTLSDVRDALAAADIKGMTVTEVQGFGQQQGHTEVYRGAEFTTEFVPKVKIEVVISDDKLQAAVNAITSAAHTGKTGDGKIWVTNVEHVIRVRTGEQDNEAL
ncbi:P-II family nitrogen regulator [Corynebacterium lubricantis]|uniref:P-II family nitrogen regulator n=1 Tax=Corynebacterium lubricantis TaxID=541095 RepID=UPI0004767125|nr:P-II family nitrogen regulator [Corynebacterium lubricantis]